MEWNRRAFMKGSGLALFSASFGGTPLFLSRAADAANNPLAHSRLQSAGDNFPARGNGWVDGGDAI